MPFILELWEKAFIEAFYSFKWTDEGYQEYYEEEPPQNNLRRFKKAILLIGRKNGKSTVCAAISFAEFMCGSGGNDIICSSNDDAQASIIFEEINNMREIFDKKNKRTHKNLKGIFNLKNKSTIKKLSDRTKNKEGRNIDGAILDESNEMKDNVIAKSIEQSQSTKDEPWFINITTEGFVNNGYLDKELKYAREIINKEREDAILLVWLYTQDSEKEIWQNPRSWYKSNPSLGVVKKTKYIKDQIKKAQQDKADRVFMMAKDFNMKQNNAEAWLTEEILANEDTFNLEEFRNCYGIGAVDLSKSGDLTSARVLLMRKNDPKKYFKQMYFIPESKLNELNKQDRKMFEEWIEKGYMMKSPGNENDFRLVSKWCYELYQDYGIRIFLTGYDKWSAIYWVKEMKETYGFDCEKVNQDWGSMSEPMKLVAADLKSKLINYNNNPIDRWCLENTAFAINNKQEIMPIKIQGKADKKIDGAVTMIIAYRTYIDHKIEFLNLINRG
jgi:phage terminase large subunit-like protein